MRRPFQTSNRHGEGPKIITHSLFLTLLSFSMMWNVGTLVGFMSWPSVESEPFSHRSSLLFTQAHTPLDASPPMYSAPSQNISVAFVIPYIDGDVDHLLEAIRGWEEVGQACSSLQYAKVGLFFYNNLIERREGPRLEQLVDQLARASSSLATILNCFAEVHTIYADLRPEEDDYPEGPSVMFFKLMLQKRLRDEALGAYTHAMWMEWDLRPMRPLWIDAVCVAASSGTKDFWVRGSYYYGKGLDSPASNPDSFNWVGHINGNALYALRDPDFHAFLELVREREPPTDYWRPFDIAMWRVLQDFPYSWRIYQTYRHKFQRASFVRSVECIGAADRQFLIGDSYLAHESSSLDKKKHYVRKFSEVDGLPMTDKPLYGDEIRPNIQLSVFLPVFLSENFKPASLAFMLARKYIPHALEYVAVVLHEDQQNARAAFPEFVNVYTVSTNLGPSNLQKSFLTLQADEFCRGRHILHLDVDVAILRPVYYKDLFLLQKPIVEYTLYNDVDAQLGGGGVSQDVARQIFGHAVARDYFPVSNRHVYSQEVYSAARQYLQRRFQAQSLDEALESVGKLTNAEWFDGLNFLGQFLEFHLPHSASFVHHGPTFEHHHDVSIDRIQNGDFKYPYRELSLPSPFVVGRRSS